MSHAMTLNQKMVQYVQQTAPLLEQAAKADQEKQAADQARKTKQAQIESLIPGVVDALIAHNRIGAHQKEAAVQALRDPVQVLEILQKVAAHRPNPEVQPIGSPVPAGQAVGKEKRASRAEIMAQADRDWYAKLGVPAPTV